MATVSSETASPNTGLAIKDLNALVEALYRVRAKYKFFGLQIGVDINEIEDIEANCKDSSNCLLQILRARLKQEPALTCADIDKALRSRTVSEPQVANEFQNFKCKDQRFDVAKKYEDAKPDIRLRMIEKGSERKEKTEYYVEESKSNESENIQKAEKSAEVERQVHERDESKSKRAKKRARKKERAVKNQFPSEQPVSESAIQLRVSKRESEIIENVESDDESKTDESEDIQKTVKSAEVERQVHERDEPKSKRAKKRARKREKNQCASEQPEPDEYKKDERKQMKSKQKQKVQFSEMAASPQSGAECDQKRKKSLKESEKIAPEIMSTDSENESSDACKEKEILLSKSEKTGKVRECAAYSEVKHQPQSAKIREVKNEARKKGKIPEKEESTKKQHSVLHRKTAVTVESDEDTSERPSHKSKKKLKAEETESEESFSESTSDESETESPKHKEKVKPKSPTDTEEMYHDSDEEIEEVQKRGKKKKQRRESSMSPTAIGSSSPSTSQEEKKKQLFSKKQGHRRKHVRKMKEKSGYGRHSSVQKRKEVQNRRQEILSSSSETDSSSPECDMLKNLTKTEKKKLRTIFKRSFGKLCCARFDPVATAALLQEKGLISQVLMEEMIMSPESQQAKIIGLVKALDKRINSRPDQLFVCIEVLLESDALHKTGKDMLNKAG